MKCDPQKRRNPNQDTELMQSVTLMTGSVSSKLLYTLVTIPIHPKLNYQFSTNLPYLPNIYFWQPIQAVKPHVTVISVLVSPKVSVHFWPFDRSKTSRDNWPRIS